MYNSITMLPTESVLEEVVKLESVKRMRVSINSAIKYGTIVGATTIISGILGGPVGLAAGGIISSCVVGLVSQGKFQSVPYILLHETTPEQKKKLTTSICKLLKSTHILTIRDFILNIENNVELQQAIIQIIIAFLAAEFSAKVEV